jgi:hypothetical protein
MSRLGMAETVAWLFAAKNLCHEGDRVEVTVVGEVISGFGAQCTSIASYLSDTNNITGQNVESTDRVTIGMGKAVMTLRSKFQ